jgi:hypothetical protein
MRPDSSEVGPRPVSGSLPPSSQGEYLFFLIGSAEPPKGSQGKGYDLGIDEPVTLK